MDNLVSALDASSLCGVSEKTLSRFADAGYLRSESRENKLFFYSEELSSTFGVTVPTPIALEPTLSKQVETIVRNPEAEKPYVEPTNKAQEGPVASAPESTEATSQTKADPDVSVALEALKASHQVEINRLATVIALQEKLIDLKESEIKDIKEQRDWLKARIEKLEEKTDRDQLILASLSQTNRSLITLVENKRSPVRSALEWFGLIPPRTDNNSVNRIGEQ